MEREARISGVLILSLIAFCAKSHTDRSSNPLNKNDNLMYE